ncbi:hypothetical protein HMPREF9607_02087 [Cutibacterium modestum HL044PA1]|uniref:Uncharacterized protein n=1 Tax=Cutibacterium modestum HL044PA1 TaxID=765109 RepID=A0ABP2K408_9ACTN|nr:hypothetical protein HMPREF9607_02087 [Cutibacterium modestum HL044PA1]
MMTPPLSMSANPRLTRVVPVLFVSELCSLMDPIESAIVVHGKIHI